ncbi:MAG: peptidoglycan DD-metalloendopeptidase family protein [Spirulinaceae cyanobacterium]
MVMPDWGWLSRGAILGILGTATITTLVSFNQNLPEAQTPLIETTSSPQNRPSESTSRRKVVPMTVPVRYSPPEPGSLPDAPSSDSASTKTPPQAKAQRPPKPLEPLIPHERLFETPLAIGMLAIGAAEGNYRVYREQGTLYVEQLPAYFGHTDPGNLSWGDRVTNYGPCSDQGRSRGNLRAAEEFCLNRAKQRLPTNLADLEAAGVDPNGNLEAILNVADLYNQASPIHSRRFPQALAIARLGGKTGIEAIAWARTASFYLNQNDELDLENGTNRATGLLGICRRENRAVTEWECVYQDQLRRVQAIAHIIEQYFQIPDSAMLAELQLQIATGQSVVAYQLPAQGRITKGFSDKGKQRYTGVAIAATEGTKVLAAASGRAIAVGRANSREVAQYTGKDLGEALVVVLEHENGDRTLYAHNQKNLVQVGQEVQQGEAIALVGDTGEVSRSQLHFEIHRDNQPVDPLNYIDL